MTSSSDASRGEHDFPILEVLAAACTPGGMFWDLHARSIEQGYPPKAVDVAIVRALVAVRRELDTLRRA